LLNGQQQQQQQQQEQTTTTNDNKNTTYANRNQKNTWRIFSKRNALTPVNPKGILELSLDFSCMDCFVVLRNSGS